MAEFLSVHKNAYLWALAEGMVMRHQLQLVGQVPDVSMTAAQYQLLSMNPMYCNTIPARFATHGHSGHSGHGHVQFSQNPRSEAFDQASASDAASSPQASSPPASAFSEPTSASPASGASPVLAPEAQVQSAPSAAPSAPTEIVTALPIAPKPIVPSKGVHFDWKNAAILRGATGASGATGANASGANASGANASGAASAFSSAVVSSAVVSSAIVSSVRASSDSSSVESEDWQPARRARSSSRGRERPHFDDYMAMRRFKIGLNAFNGFGPNERPESRSSGSSGRFSPEMQRRFAEYGEPDRGRDRELFRGRRETRDTRDTRERERFSEASFKSAGLNIAKDIDSEWVNGCKFPRASWPLKADGSEYEKIMHIAEALGLDFKKGDSGKEVYLKFVK